MIIFISSKFIVPRDKYINENPKSNNPDAKEPKTKYFIPDSDDLRSSLSIDAKI